MRMGRSTTDSSTSSSRSVRVSICRGGYVRGGAVQPDPILLPVKVWTTRCADRVRMSTIANTLSESPTARSVSNRDR